MDDDFTTYAVSPELVLLIARDWVGRQGMRRRKG